jgi:glycosyltransferase involved in cell wall biosynthesis
MRVSVIITTYNSPIYLKKVLDGFLYQKIAPHELIIADDGSGNDTAQVIKSFSEISPFPVLHIWQEHKGFRAAKNRNEAIKQSSGDYIILLDGDCVINSIFISDHLYLSEKGFFIQGKRILINNRASIYFTCSHANSYTSLVKMALKGNISNIHHLIRFPFFPAFKSRHIKGIKSCNMSFFKQDILAVNGFNEDFVGWGNEDSELACRFFKYGLIKKVHHFMTLCFHLWHPTNKIVSEKNKQLLSESIASKEYFCRNGLVKRSA